jgi:hypothetical protein
MATLKKLLGDAGAGIDDSHGSDRLYDVLSALITEHNDLVAQFNQLLTDYNAETVAAHTTSTATTVTPTVTVE